MTFAHHAGYEHGAIELKGDEADPADAVTKAIADLNTLVEGKFKTLETKSADRLDKLEARMNRPAGGTETKAAPALEQKAFASYLHHGEQRMSADELKALTVSTDSAGGYLSPPEFGNELLKYLVQYSPIRSYARVVNTNASSIRYPRRTSSLTAAWYGETATRTASQPVFDDVILTPYELSAVVEVSNVLLEDNAYDLESELYAEFAEQFGKAEGAAFVSGNGTTQPKGLLVASLGEMFGTAFPIPDFGDTLIKMFHSLPAMYAQNGTWMMNRNTLATLRLIKDSVGRYMVLDGLSDGAPVTLLGRPIVEVIDMPDIAAGTTPIVFGDMKGYRIVDRIQVQVLRDPYSLSNVGQTRFVARKRVGADVTNPDRFVALAIAGS